MALAAVCVCVFLRGSDSAVSCPPGYNAPYLSVYSENAVDVFDVNTMEWIQSIPLKKVIHTLTHTCTHTCTRELTEYLTPF